MPQFRNGKLAGVLNNSDSSTNEMSYVDMHDLHPENVQAAAVQGALNGVMEGVTIGAMPGAAIAYLMAKRTAASGLEITTSGLKIGAAFVAMGAAIMGAIRSYTARKNAETHNAWSERVISRMEQREAVEMAEKHTNAVTTKREQDAQAPQGKSPTS